MKLPRYVKRTWRKNHRGCYVYDIQDFRHMISCCGFQSRRRAEVAYTQAIADLRAYRRTIKSIKLCDNVSLRSHL